MIGIFGKGNFSKLIQEIFNQKKINFTVSDYLDTKENIENVLKCDYIILAVPAQYINNYLKYITNQIIIDICSVKEYPKELYVKHNVSAILTHPMFGPNSYKEFGLKDQKIMLDLSLFKGNTEEIFNFLRNLELEIIEMSSKEHDEITAKTLALHHIVGRIIPEINNEKLDTSNYRKILEVYKSVKNDSDDLFISLIKYNKYVKNEIELIKNRLNEIIKGIY